MAQSTALKQICRTCVRMVSRRTCPRIVNPQGSGANGLGECRLVVVHVAGWGPEPVPLVSPAPTVPDAGLADKPADALLVTAASPTGQRYIHHREEGSTVHLFSSGRRRRRRRVALRRSSTPDR